MAVPSTFSELSTTPGSNSGLISNATAVGLIDDHMQWAYAALASIQANSGNGWTSPYLTAANPVYTGTLTGGTGVLNLGSGQFYKDASGNVGIGTAAPTQRLQLAGALFVNGPATLGAQTGPGLFALENPAFREYIGDGTGYNRHWSRRIASVTTDLVTIKDTGNVGIATTAPTHKLHVAGSLRVDAATSNSATAGLAAALPATPAGYVTINVGGTDYKLPYYDA